MARPCYSGDNPIKDDKYDPANPKKKLWTRDEKVLKMWKWAKENSIDQFGREVPKGIDAGIDFGTVRQSINTKYFGGSAKEKWIDEFIAGRKMPLREVLNDAWRTQYNRRQAVQQAENLSKRAAMGTFSKVMDTLWMAPRSLAVTAHAIVFPITHGGDLAFRPQSWGTLIKGMFQTYVGSYNKAFAEKVLTHMEGDALYNTGVRSGIEVGPGSHPTGILSEWYKGPSERAWKMLSVMRYNLWKGQMLKVINSGMSEAEVLEFGKQYAQWANNATGAGKGAIAKLGSKVLFGPKLTQSKINRLFSDPIQTIKTFGEWGSATEAERAVALTRLSGATQFAVTNLGFLAVNQGLLYALGSDEKVNWTDPTKSDYFQMKGGGLVGNVPGLHSEIKTLAKILAVSWTSRSELHGESRYGTISKTLGQYALGKATPPIQRVREAITGENYRGQPLPWRSDLGTEKAPRMTWPEYAASIGPIPLEGPVGYVFDEFRKGGMSALDATAIIKGLIIGGMGLPGFHVKEAPHAPEVTASRRPLTNSEMNFSEVRRGR